MGRGAEVGAEVAARQLRRRRPERARARGVVEAGEQRRAKVARQGAGQQSRAQHRAEGGDRHLGARAGGDRLGGDIGLLSREPALLDRKPGRIACGPDIGQPLDVEARVGRDEAPTPLRNPVDLRDLERRQGDDVVRCDLPSAPQLEPLMLEPERRGLRPQLDPGLGQELADDLRRALAEQLQRPRLVRRERDLDSRNAAGAQVGRGQQSQLVGGKRPAGLRRHRKHQTCSVAGLQLVEEVAERLASGAVAEGERAVDRGDGTGAGRDQKSFVVERRAAARSGSNANQDRPRPASLACCAHRAGPRGARDRFAPRVRARTARRRGAAGRRTARRARSTRPGLALRRGHRAPARPPRRRCLRPRSGLAVQSESLRFEPSSRPSTPIAR